jgi:predicted helicase
MDLGGDVRANAPLSGTRHNVFGIQTGVAIAFLVKTRRRPACANLHYARRPEMEPAQDKPEFLSTTQLASVIFETVDPDSKHNWLGLTHNDWDALIPVADKSARADQKPGRDRAIFRLMSNGLQTKRDDWVYDFTKEGLIGKLDVLLEGYESARQNPEAAALNEIKWDRELSRHLERKTFIQIDYKKIVCSNYRPYVTKYVYFDRLLNSQSFQLHSIYQEDESNETIAFLCVSSANSLAVLAVSRLFDTCFLKMGNGATQGLPRFRISRSGQYIDNVTDWALVH